MGELVTASGRRIILLESTRNNTIERFLDHLHKYVSAPQKATTANTAKMLQAVMVADVFKWPEITAICF